MATNTETRTPAISAEIVARVLTLTFADGERIQIDADTLTEEVRERALMHGLKQKAIDAGAISRNPDTGRSATVADKRAAVIEVVERLRAGQWNKQRGDGAGAGGLLFRALVAIYPNRTPEALRVWLDGMDEKQQAAIRRVPKIAAEIDRLRAVQAAASGIDADALLAGLDGE